MRYAVVRGGNLIDNIIECNGLTVQSLEKVMNCLLVPCEQYPVARGDLYENGVFYRMNEKAREKEVIQRIPTDSEKISMLESENAVLKNTVSNTFQAQLISDRATETNYITDNMILYSTAVVDYPEYQDNHEYKLKGEIIRYNNRYYEIIAPHTSNSVSYPVETTFAYYRLIELVHTGTVDDPIPYPETSGIVVNVKEGLYYSYKGKLYVAKADMPNCVYPPDTQSMWQWEEVDLDGTPIEKSSDENKTEEVSENLEEIEPDTTKSKKRM